MPPDVDFARIRPYGTPPSRSGGFEELASILVQDGIVEWPRGTRFERFGNPDGGREGRGILPNGRVWAWQVKYLFEFDAAAVAQLSDSIERTIALETELDKYIVVLPIDLPAGDTDERVSAHTRWAAKVEEWTRDAAREGRRVEFVYVGAHELLSALSRSAHAGRAAYWFDTDVLTQDWQAHRLEEAIAKAGRRYSPRVHVPVEAERAIEAVSRSEAFVGQWRAALAELRDAKKWGWRPPKEAEAALQSAVAACIPALDTADGALNTFIASLGANEDLPEIGPQLEAARVAAYEVDSVLHDKYLKPEGYFVGDAATLYSQCRRAISAIVSAERLNRSPHTAAARVRAILISGRAGTGKTHLLCDSAVRRLEIGAPTLFTLGQDVDGRSITSQYRDLFQLGDSPEECFATLEAAAEAAHSIGLVLVDALNESTSPERWKDELPALLAIASRFPHVGLVVSCRTEFLAEVVGDATLPEVEHLGFGEATDVAVARFADEYGIEAPGFPVLNPEFSNPLFLKLACEALETLGTDRFPLGAAGLLTVMDAYLDAANVRLSEPSRCDFDPRSAPVREVVQRLAGLRVSLFDRADVERICNEVLPGRTWSRSLMRGLISDGVLVEVGGGRVAFAYQRLGDVLRAEDLARMSSNEIRGWASEQQTMWRERGVLGALAFVLPERKGLELVDVLVDNGKVDRDLVDGFLESLLLRAPNAASKRTLEIMTGLLQQDDWMGEAWDRLLRLACVPGHPLNSAWLHAYLFPLSIAARDSVWSNWLAGALDDEASSVVTLIDWAWPSDGTQRRTSAEVVTLAVRALSWMLTSSDRKVRDRATKAIVAIGSTEPDAMAGALDSFVGVNDPYVVERLAAASCGIALRLYDAVRLRALADSIAHILSEPWPAHLLVRDYARHLMNVVPLDDQSSRSGQPPYGAQWPVVSRRRDEIDELAGPPQYLFGSIWHSLTKWGDFGRYVIEPALDHFETQERQALQDEVERAIFDRTLDLGWTPERFQQIDTARSHQDRSMVERIGKKYQWIGLYEVLGRIADNLQVREWDGSHATTYDHAEQVIWRDIDPTVLRRKPRDSESAQPWFAPVVAEFSGGSDDDFLSNTAGLPDPLDLIAVEDQDRVRHLVLVGQPEWKEFQPPEVQALEVPRRAAWFYIHAYLVPNDHSEELARWAADQDWQGRWMPGVSECHNVLLGTHPSGPGWAIASGDLQEYDTASAKLPCTVYNPAAWYGGTGTSRDGSADRETLGYVPTRRLLDTIGLGPGVDFAWSDTVGTAIQDPSIRTFGPSCLVIRRDLADMLAERGLSLLWTVLAAKEIRYSHLTATPRDFRWISGSAAYAMTNNRVTRLASRAGIYRPGPTLEAEVRWATRTDSA